MSLSFDNAETSFLYKILKSSVPQRHIRPSDQLHYRE